MAEQQDSIRREPPLGRRVNSTHIIYSGSRAQLIEAGVIDEGDPLPGDPGLRKGYLRFEGHPRRISGIWRRGTRFTVAVDRPPEEVAAEKRRIEREQAERHYASELKALPNRISDLTDSHDAYRESREEILRWLIAAGRVLTEPSGGYSFSEETRNLVEHHIDGIRQAIAEGVTRFRRSDLEEQIEGMRAKVRNIDPEFGNFLKRIGGAE